MKTTKVIRQGKKYHNKITAYDGKIFDSTAELLRYKHLVLLQDKSVISDLQAHKSYVIIPKSKYGGQHIYTPDFVYKDKDGNLVVEDVKSTATLTEVSKLRIRLFEERYGIKVNLIIKK